MKQTFYLYQYSSGDIFLSQREQNVALPIFGTIELGVQPIKKEVEKVFMANLVEDSTIGFVKAIHRVPRDAYDVKVSYKVKE